MGQGKSCCRGRSDDPAAPNAYATENVTSRCVDICVRRNAIIARNGEWIDLTSEQWQCLRDVLNPETPAGLP